MKKLKLESLEVTSFETGAAEPQERGTVHGRAKPPQTNFNCPQTMFTCPTDPNFDCTYGCSYNTACAGGCTGLTETVDCAIQ
jgi:hypothetical protein